jgi:hypothetical protein
VFVAYATGAHLIVDGARARDSACGAHRLGALTQVDDAAAEHDVSVVMAPHGDLCDVDVRGGGERLDDRAAKREIGQAPQ